MSDPENIFEEDDSIKKFITIVLEEHPLAFPGADELKALKMYAGSGFLLLTDPRGAGLQEDFQFLSVRPSVSIWFSFVLVGQYTSDPQ